MFLLFGLTGDSVIRRIIKRSTEREELHRFNLSLLSNSTRFSASLYIKSIAQRRPSMVPT